MNLNAEIQMYAGALIIVMALAVAMAVYALRTLNEKTLAENDTRADKLATKPKPSESTSETSISD